MLTLTDQRSSGAIGLCPAATQSQSKHIIFHTKRLIASSPGILGFEVEKNNIKLKISGSVYYVHLYYL